MMAYITEDMIAIQMTVIGFREDNVVTQVKTHAADGYDSVQVGYRSFRDRKFTKPEYEYLRKAGAVSLRHLQEIRFTTGDNVQSGQQLHAHDLLKEGDLVDVSGNSTGKGFQDWAVWKGFSMSKSTSTTSCWRATTTDDKKLEERIGVFSNFTSSPSYLEGLTKGVQGTEKYIELLQECISHEALMQGMQAHDWLLRDNVDFNPYIGKLLVEMYCKCGAIEEARWMFDSLDSHDVYSWNNIITAYTYHNTDDEEAVNLFHKMLSYVEPKSSTLVTILGVCANLQSLDKGKFVHNQVICYGFENNADIQTALLNVYVKCRAMDDALRVFHKLHTPNVVSFTVIIGAYVQEHQFNEAMKLFRYMHNNGIEVDGFVISAALGACCFREALEEGRLMHSLATEGGYVSDVAIETALIIMYGNCGFCEGAETVFQKSLCRTVVMFTSLITAYVQLGHSEKALLIFKEMQDEDVDANEVTFVTILGACADGTYLEYGKMLYHMVVIHGAELDLLVGSAIVNMFGKCGCSEDAQKVFDKLSRRTVVTWNALINAYVQRGDGHTALQLYNGLQSETLWPSEITYVYALAACGLNFCLEEGRSVYISLTKDGLESHEKVANALVSMYGKCGSLMETIQSFHRLHKRDIVSWNSLISAYTQHGLHKEALDFFKTMQEQGVEPDEVTFISVLNACSHAGLVIDGLQFFFVMTQNYRIQPTMEHYGCVIDLLSRAGQLENAEDFIKRMPLWPDSVAWRSFLTACQLHGESNQLQQTAENIIDSNIHEGPFYVLWANMQVADEV